MGLKKPSKQLPTLTNPAVADEIFYNKEAIDQNGEILKGTVVCPTTSTAAGTPSLSGDNLVIDSGTQENGFHIAKGGHYGLMASVASVASVAGLAAMSYEEVASSNYGQTITFPSIVGKNNFIAVFFGTISLSKDGLHKFWQFNRIDGVKMAYSCMASESGYMHGAYSHNSYNLDTTTGKITLSGDNYLPEGTFRIIAW